jgi:hypothetical protein
MNLYVRNYDKNQGGMYIFKNKFEKYILYQTVLF